MNAALSYFQGNHEHVSEIMREVLTVFPNHAPALFELAMMYARGRGGEQNAVQAFHLFEQAHEEGHAEATYNLGFMYATG